MKKDDTHDCFEYFCGVISLEELWEACQRYVEAHFEIHNNFLLGMPSIGKLPIFLRTKLPSDESGADYWERLADTVKLGDVAAQFPGLPASRMSDVFRPDQNARDRRLLDEFMRPEGWSYACAILLWDERNRFVGELSLNRRESQGDFTEQEMHQLVQAQPHVNAAALRALKAESELQKHRSIERNLSALVAPVLILDWEGKPLTINTAAREILLMWEPQGTRKAIDTIYRQTESIRSERSKRRLGARTEPLQIKHPMNEGLFALVQLIEPAEQAASLPTLLINLHAPPSLFPGVQYAIQNLEYLTAAELKVARLAASGFSNADIVRELYISESTVKTHLRAIFRKLKISRRGQLSALFRDLEPPIEKSS